MLGDLTLLTPSDLQEIADRFPSAASFILGRTLARELLQMRALVALSDSMRVQDATDAKRAAWCRARMLELEQLDSIRKAADALHGGAE